MIIRENMNDDLQKRIQAALANPQNLGELAGADAVGTVGNADCGEMLRLWVKFKEQNGKRVIDRATFQSFGCETAIAVASLATELIRGKTAEEALALKTEELAGELGPLPPMKIHCAQLVEGALRSALEPAAAAKPAPAPIAPTGAPTLLDSFSQPKQGREADFLGRPEKLGFYRFPQFFQGRQSRFAFGGFFAFTVTAREFRTVVHHGAFELAVMVRAGGGEHLIKRGVGRPRLQQLLQFAFRIFNARRVRWQRGEIRRKLAQHKLPRGFKAAVQKDGSEQGFKAVRQRGFSFAPAHVLLAPAQHQVWSQPQGAGVNGQGAGIHQLGAGFGQDSLIRVGQGFVEMARENHAQHRIAQKLQSLIMRQGFVLVVREGGMRQRQAE